MSLSARRYKPKPRHGERHLCARKTGYATMRHAHRARIVCEAFRPVRLRVYRCDWCDRWHLTSKE
jgi:hypothetical protein